MAAGLPLGVAAGTAATGTAAAAGTAAATAAATSAALASTAAIGATTGAVLVPSGAVVAGAGIAGPVGGLTAGVVGAGGGGLLAGVFGSFTTAELISGGFTVASGVANIAKGRIEKKQADFAAKFSTLGAERAALEGRRKAIIALEEANRVEARQTAAIGASGITFEGTPEVSLARTRETGAANVSLARLEGAVGSAAGQLEAATLRSKGRAAQTGGFISALHTGGSFASRFIRRRG